jgi:hypothetical protein
VGFLRFFGREPMAKKSTSLPKMDLEPDAWERFERAVDVAAKSPPQHRTNKKENPTEKKPRRRGIKKAQD